MTDSATIELAQVRTFCPLRSNDCSLYALLFRRPSATTWKISKRSTNNAGNLKSFLKSMHPRRTCLAVRNSVKSTLNGLETFHILTWMALYTWVMLSPSPRSSLRRAMSECWERGRCSLTDSTVLVCRSRCAILYSIILSRSNAQFQASSDKIIREIELFGEDFERFKPDALEEPAESQPTAAGKAPEKGKKGKVAAKATGHTYQFQIMESIGVPREEIKRFADPMYWLEYFPPIAQVRLCSSVIKIKSLYI